MDSPASSQSFSIGLTEKQPSVNNNKRPVYWVGLMSGTSLDGIDAVVTRINDNQPCELIASHFQPFEPELKAQLQSVIGATQIDVMTLGALDRAFSFACAEAVNTLLKEAGITTESVRAIGSHGLTLFHAPNTRSALQTNLNHGFTWQIGDPNTLAHETGIAVVADFRRADIAKGGQGAPLVPPFHQALYAAQAPCVVVNIGGIANISVVQANCVTGFDTGPGNCLMDAWIAQHHDKDYDADGAWAASGRANDVLLSALLGDAYFHQAAPKSTGKEYFNMPWLAQNISAQELHIAPEDIQATLLQLTAQSITDAISAATNAAGFSTKHYPVFVCGGGAKNVALMQLMAEQLPNAQWQTTAASRGEHDKGINADWIEACAFAWLAYRRWHHLPSNAPEVTGASAAVSLGGIYLP